MFLQNHKSPASLNNLLLGLLSLYAFSLFWGSIPYVGRSFSFLTGIALATVALIQISTLKLRPRPLFLVYGLWALLFLIAGTDVTFTGKWQVHPIVSGLLLQVVFFSILVHLFCHNPRLSEGVQSALIIGGVCAGLLSTLKIGVVQQQYSDRISFIHINFNDYAALLLLSCTFLIYRIYDLGLPKGPKGLIWLLALSFLINGLLDTGTRFAILCLACIYGILLIGSAVKKQNITSVLAVCTVPIFVLILKLFLVSGMKFVHQIPTMLEWQKEYMEGAPKSLLPSPEMHYREWEGRIVAELPPAVSRFLTSDPGPGYNNLSDLGGRLPAWQNAFNAFVESPIFGHGYFGFEIFTARTFEYFPRPHNVVLEVAAVSGALGLIFLFVYLMRLFWTAFVFSRKDNLVKVSCFTLPLIFFANFLNITHFKPFWLMLAMLVAMVQTGSKTGGYVPNSGNTLKGE